MRNISFLTMRVVYYGWGVEVRRDYRIDARIKQRFQDVPAQALLRPTKRAVQAE
jgi:hypothetical protein